MGTKRFRLLLLVAVTSVFCLTALSSWGGVPRPMQPARLVNDFAGLFTSAQTLELEDSLTAFDRSTSTQIAIVTLDDLDGYSPVEMSASIIDQWGVGQKGKDNGIVMLIKPRNANGRGEVFIATGGGLEGVLPDGKATRIIDRVMMRSLKTGDYFSAARDGAAAIRGVVRGEFTALDGDVSPSLWALVPMAIFVMLVVFVIIAARKRGKGGDDDSNGSGGGGGRGFIPPIFWGLGGFGGGRSGGGGFGGSSGGGFGGFGGGGSFGGGGGRSF